MSALSSMELPDLLHAACGYPKGLHDSLDAIEDEVDKMVKCQELLSSAAMAGFVRPIKMLLAMGADPNLMGVSSGSLPLHWAAHGNHIPAMETLLDAGAELGLCGEGILDMTARNGHVKAVRKLLQAGMKP